MSEKIDINTADAATLTAISGIGPALAERIIEYRETVHPFEEVIELTAVPGISEKMVRSFADLVTVQSTPLALEEPEEVPLLETPEEVILLGAPDEPEGLLPAELPADTVEEPDLVEAASTEPDRPEEVEAAPAVEEAELEENVAETAEAEQAEAEMRAAEAEAAESGSPKIEDLPLAESMNPAMPDPDLYAVAPTQPAADWEAKIERRGCLNALIGATFGAILGAVLTLAILAALNQGSLSFAASDIEIRQQLNTEIISRTNELNQLSTRVSLAATQEAAANQSLQAGLAATSEALSEELANSEAAINELATRSGEIEQRLEEVAGAADTFTGFLDGLRLLLADLEEGTVTATPTPVPEEETVSPTPTPASSQTLTPAATVTASPTGAPTRTPQPTATPFRFPTNTPAPQP